MQKKAKTLLKAIIVAFAIVMFWRGVWGLADVYLFPNDYALSSWISLFIGLVILIMNKRMIKNFMYD